MSLRHHHCGLPLVLALLLLTACAAPARETGRYDDMLSPTVDGRRQHASTAATVEPALRDTLVAAIHAYLESLARAQTSDDTLPPPGGASSVAPMTEQARRAYDSQRQANMRTRQSLAERAMDYTRAEVDVRVTDITRAGGTITVTVEEMTALDLRFHGATPANVPRFTRYVQPHRFTFQEEAGQWLITSAQCISPRGAVTTNCLR